MSVAEVAWRLTKVARNEAWKITKRGNFPPLPDLVAGTPELQPIVPPQQDKFGTDPADCIAAADLVLAGKFCVFGVPVELRNRAPEWNKDPLTGICAPMDFGPTLDYRDERLVGDIKCLWEPNRHLQIVTLAQAAQVTSDEKYRIGLERFLLTWLDECPYLMGPNWTSSLELAIRLINWSITWRILDSGNMEPLADQGEKSLRQRLLKSVYQHVFFITHHYSKFSSANNHLIGEAAGVFVAACTWPHWPEMTHWRQQSLEILTRELDRQTTADGFNAELSTAYHEFVMEFALAGLQAADASGYEIPDSYRASLSQMSKCAGLIQDVSGNVPMFGDADDGHVFRLSYEDGFDSLRATFHTCSAALDQTDIVATHIDAQSLWLLNDEKITSLKSSPRSKNCDGEVAMTDAGYYLLGKNLNTPDEIRLWVDAGRLGFLSIAAHGHADSLSIYLAAYCEEILIDPGTYSYHTEKSWHDYFKGTSAHNTVGVDGVDQSVSGGNFMWTQHATTTVNETMSTDKISVIFASHDGYCRLADPVVHKRAVSFDKDSNLITVEDIVECAGTHSIDVYWHFAEHVSVNSVVSEKSWCARGSKTFTDFQVNSDGGPLDIAVIRGQEVPPLGWVSRKFALKRSTTTVRCSQKITGRTRITTKILIKKGTTEEHTVGR